MKGFIIGVLVIAGGLFLLERVMGQTPDRRSYRYFDDMAESFAYRTQSPNPYLPNGQTEQPPPPGTIARGETPLHYGASEAELVRAGEELTNPFAADTTANTARGRVVYQTFCRPCHGDKGQGDGPVTQRGFPPPPSLFSEQTIDRTDGQMFYIITYGHNNMPSYAAQVSREDRWHAVTYVRQLQHAAQAAPENTEAKNDTLHTQP